MSQTIEQLKLEFMDKEQAFNQKYQILESETAQNLADVDQQYQAKVTELESINHTLTQSMLVSKYEQNIDAKVHETEVVNLNSKITQACDLIKTLMTL